MKDVATYKQVGFALRLLGENGYPTDRMGARHKGLPGATMNARRGTVREWLSGLDRDTASRLIARLKERAAPGGVLDSAVVAAAHSAAEEGSSRAQAWLARHGYPDRPPSPAAERFRAAAGK